MAGPNSSAPSEARRLAAILFSDIRGYSSQMESNEDAALRRLDEHNAIFRARVDEHRGRVVKTVGDAFMVEFGSAIDAVRCALAVLRDLSQRNEGVEDEAEHIIVRIGVHFGDVIEREGDLFGETVNLAARLEPQAPPGAVCITEEVLRQVRRKVSARAASLGPRRMKNIAEPMRLTALTPASAWSDSSPSKTESKRPPLVAFGAIAAAIVVGATVWGLPKLDSPQPVSSVQPPMASTPVATKPRRGGVLRVGRAAAMGHLNPLDLVGTLSRTASDLVVEPLADFDGSGEPALRVLESAEITDGVLELVLRSDVRFHPHPCLADKARSATAKDVHYSIELAASLPAFQLPIEGLEDYRAKAVRSLDAVTVTGERTVMVKLEHSTPFVLAYLWPVQLLPVELANCEEDIRDMKRLVGTGPFRMADPIEKSRIPLARNDDYRDEREMPLVDGLTLEPLEEGHDGVARLERGDLDVLVVDAGATRGIVEEEDGRFAVSGSPSGLVVEPTTIDNLYLPLLLVALRNEGPLSKQAVRQAVGHAIDRDAVVTKHPRPLLPMRRPYPPGTLGRNLSAEGFVHDPDRARRLLAKAGHAGGQGLDPIVLAAPPDRLEIARAMSKQLEAVGIPMRVEQVDLSGASALFRDRNIDALLIFTYTDKVGPEPFNFVAQYMQPLRKHGVIPKETEDLLAQLHATKTRVDREPIYSSLEAELIELAWTLPIAMLKPGAPHYLVIARDHVHGLERMGQPPTWFRKTWLGEPRSRGTPHR